MKWFLEAGRVLLAALQEIFDEAAYARFLERMKIASSVEAYSAFLRDRERSERPMPRCC